MAQQQIYPIFLIFPTEAIFLIAMLTSLPTTASVPTWSKLFHRYTGIQISGHLWFQTQEVSFTSISAFSIGRVIILRLFQTFSKQDIYKIGPNI